MADHRHKPFGGGTAGCGAGSEVDAWLVLLVVLLFPHTTLYQPHECEFDML